jgi:hypothetical protein
LHVQDSSNTVISIETLRDVTSLSLEEVTRWLRSVEEDGVSPPATEGKLYLTEEEWLQSSKKKESDSGRGSSSI